MAAGMKSGKQTPLSYVQARSIALTASAYDLVGIDQPEVLALIERFLVTGVPFMRRRTDSRGVSSVNVAAPWANGRNSLEFAQLLYEIDSSPVRKQIVEILTHRQ